MLEKKYKHKNNKVRVRKKLSVEQAKKYSLVKVFY